MSSKHTEVDQAFDYILDMRLTHDLSHVLFTFPRVKKEPNADWQASSPYIIGCHVAAKRDANHPDDQNLPYTVKGVEQIEFDVTKPNVKRLMNIGVLTMVRHRNRFRISFPPEIREINGSYTVAFVDVPPFHVGATPNMEIISALQRTCQKISRETFPVDQWVNPPRRRIKELNGRRAIRRRNDLADARLYLWMKQNNRCSACRRRITLAQATIDHELPRAMHGPHKLANMTVTCERCNLDKGMSLPYGLQSNDPRWENYEYKNGLYAPAKLSQVTNSEPVP